jgi:hypothetical protein
MAEYNEIKVEESEFLIFAKIIDKLKQLYSKECQKEGIEEGYYPIVITVYKADIETFKPIKKIVEIDERCL